MKTFLLSTLFLVFNIGLYAQEKTYIIEIEKFTLNSVTITEYDYYIRAKCDDVYGEWSEKQSFTTTNVFHYLGSEAFEVYFENITNKSATAYWNKVIGGAPRYYIIEYGPKGFERGQGQMQSEMISPAYLSGLEPNTEYSFFIRSNYTSATDSVWFTEHTFNTFPCNTEISGIESEEMWTTCECDNGAVGVEIKWNDMADFYELEYGLKGFQKGTGEKIEPNMGNNDVFISYENLTSYTDYDFYIRAKCNGEFGEWTKNSFSTTQLNTGIENVRNSNFEIYPNPVEDILHIKFSSAFDIESIVVYVFDLTGSIRYKSGYKDNYNVSSLPKGSYIVNVRDKNFSEAMIIQKR